MNGFWDNVFEYVKERRNVAVFFGTLAVFGGLLLLATVFGNLQQAWPMILPGVGILLLALIWRGIQQIRARRLNRYKTSPLSRDELAKARSKLRTKSNFKPS
jgi:hypothetical protein